jgi:ribosomal protein L37AE/L43A
LKGWLRFPFATKLTRQGRSQSHGTRNAASRLRLAKQTPELIPVCRLDRRRRQVRHIWRCRHCCGPTHFSPPSLSPPLSTHHPVLPPLPSGFPSSGRHSRRTCHFPAIAVWGGRFPRPPRNTFASRTNPRPKTEELRPQGRAWRPRWFSLPSLREACL